MAESLSDALERVMGLLAAYCAHTREPEGCSDHSDAPHGFDRNGSHNEDRYVCDCESWTPAPADDAECRSEVFALFAAHGPALLAAVRDGERWRHFREHGEKVRAPYCLFEFGCAPEMLDAAVDDAILLAAELGSRNG